MKSGKLTNTLLALIFLALLAHLIVPLLTAKEARAINEDSVSPAAVAAGAGFTALDTVATEISSGLRQIAQSNKQIASAIREHARSSDHIAQSLEGVADEVKALGLSARAQSPARTASPAPAPSGEEGEEEPRDKDWWKGLVPE